MTEKRIGMTDSANVRSGKGVETEAVAAPVQKVQSGLKVYGQSASNLLGALPGKPAVEAGAGASTASSPAAEKTSSKKS